MPALPALDRRLVEIRHLDYPFTFAGYRTRSAWLKRAAALRNQLRMAVGLWPEPPRGPLNPVVTRRSERDGFSVENIYFESHPGFFVTGNLYRPHPLPPGKLPALLVAHGHWKEGRLVNRSPEEDSMPGLCINIARRGGIAFSYDMIGYNDSCQLPHQFGRDEADKLALWGLCLMSLQAFNSLRAVDYLLALPETDPQRLAITGASGGGTQTFILAALDDRIRACAPAVMVSSIMQGGCLCENAPGLRVGANNMEIAALAAPRPQLLISCTGDWTSNTPWNELPAVRRIYQLYGKPAAGRIENYHQQAGHNYNRKSREALYGWLGRLWFGIKDPAYAAELPFDAGPLDDLRVFPGRKPPAGSQTPESLTAYVKERAQAWLEARKPVDAASLKRFRKEAGPLLAQVLGVWQPKAGEILAREESWTSFGQGKPACAGLSRLWLSRKGVGDLLHGTLAWPAGKKRAPLVVVMHNQGSWALFDMARGEPGVFVSALLAAGSAALVLDTFEANALFGKRARLRNHDLGYNKPAICERVQDVLTALGWALGQKRVQHASLAGLKFGTSTTLLARAQATGVRRTLVDANGFNSADDDSYYWDACAPGLRLAGGLPAAAALAAPGELCLVNTAGKFDTTWAEAAYRAANASQRLSLDGALPEPAALAAWLTR